MKNILFINSQNLQMKKLSKLVAAAVVAGAIFFGTSVKAQTAGAGALRLGIGVEGGIPTGSIHDASSFELGGSARLQYGLSDNLALTLTSGYTNFFIKDAYQSPAVPSSYG